MLYSFQTRKTDYDRIPIILTMLGISHHQEPVYRPRGLPVHQIFYCTAGKGEVLIDNRKYVIEKNQCFFIMKDTTHEYHSVKGQDWVLDIVGFNGAIAPLLLRMLRLNKSGACLMRRIEVFEEHIDKLDEISRGNYQRKKVMLSKELYSLLVDLSQDITLVASERADYGNPIITQTIDYIEQHCGEDISLDQMANAVSRTPEYLCSLFKKYMGITPLNYITNTRLLRAKLLLVREPATPIVEIAARCGFSNPSYFGHVFKKNYSMTPNQYRMKYIGQ